MLAQYGPEHSWHILTHHRRVEQSSSVEKFGSIHEVGVLGSVGNDVSSGHIPKR